jgi:hypothetical protein
MKVSVPSSIAVDRRFKSRVKPKTIILVFVASPLSSINEKEQELGDWELE